MFHHHGVTASAESTVPILIMAKTLYITYQSAILARPSSLSIMSISSAFTNFNSSDISDNILAITVLGQRPILILQVFVFDVFTQVSKRLF